MNPLLTIEKEGEVIKLVARDYIGRNTCLGITHIKHDGWLKTAAGEFLSHNTHPNCMLLEGDPVTLWATRSIFVGDDLSIDFRLYEKYI